MKAILIGSRAYKNSPDCGDTDIVCDREWREAWDRTYGPLAKPRTDGRYDSDTAIYETCDGIFEVIVPREGSAHDELLHVSEPWEGRGPAEFSWLPDGLTLRVTPVVFLAALKKAHLILPSSSFEKWCRQADEYAALKEILRLAKEAPATAWIGDAAGRFDEDGWQPTYFAKAIFERHRMECLAKQKKPPVLAQGKDDFFGREAYEVFDHDDVHGAVSFPRDPAYLQIKDAEVWCSRAKWRRLGEAERLRCVVEECCVLALERSVIPHLFLGKGYRGSRWAFDMALHKVSTTITSGFFRDFAIERWSEARAAVPDYVAAFLDGVKRGAVKVKRPEVMS